MSGSGDPRAPGPEEAAGARPTPPDNEPPGGASSPEPDGEPDPPKPAPPTVSPGVRRFLRTGFALYPVVAAALWLWTGLDAWNALFLAALVELLPVLAVAQASVVLGDEELNRPSAYVTSSGAILVLGWLSLVLGEGAVGYAGMGLTAVGAWELLVWAGVGVAAGLAMVGVSHVVERILGLEESPLLRQILPRTRFEKGLFAGVSLSAGLGEELAYRSYAIPVLAILVDSLWGAALLSSGIFGFLHAYQGVAGVVRTALMGFVLAAIFLLSGSVWPAIVAHTVIDLVGGLVLGPRMLKGD